MKKTPHEAENGMLALEKTPIGIRGLDEITGGGLPKGRPTLVCGGTGCGKTLLAMEFLVRGAVRFGEKGVFISFEEKVEELVANFASLGFDLLDLSDSGILSFDYVHIDKSEIEETGDYDLEGLFIRIGHAIDLIGAKRVVLDTIEALFSGFSNEMVLRAELRRLFSFLKSKGVTAIITGEQGERSLTRFGLEEYVADCVILLSHHVSNQIATRRLRIVKYRGTAHGTNEYPFMIDAQGFSVLPLSSLGLIHEASSERIATGIDRLDTMLGGKGYFRGSSILISGVAGTGKSSVAAQFVDAACARGERCLYFSFEESQNQIMRNMLSIGIDLKRWVEKGQLRFMNSRPTLYGLEMHLVLIHKEVDAFGPSIVVVDPISNLNSSGSDAEVKSMLSRLIDYLKMKQITAVCTDLLPSSGSLQRSEIGVSSLMDSWLMLQVLESSGERNRGLYVLKSRGMGHSNQIREFLMSDRGIQLQDVYVGPGGVLTGAARAAQDSRERGEILARSRDFERKKRAIERKKNVIDARILALRTRFEGEMEELDRLAEEIAQGKVSSAAESSELVRLRMADKEPPEPGARAHGAKRGSS